MKYAFSFPRMFAKATAVILVLAIAVKPMSASAVTVFDPWNYSRNVLTAARSLEQINHQIASLANEARMLINHARNLEALPNSLAAEIESDFAEIKALLGQAEQLAYDVNAIDRRFDRAYQDFASNTSDRQILDGARQRWLDSLASFEHALKAGAVAAGHIERANAQTNRLVDASQSAVGILQAAQAGNQLIAVQSRQLADLTAMLAAQGRSVALEQARAAAAEEQAREQFSRFMAGADYKPSAVKMFHQ